MNVIINNRKIYYSGFPTAKAIYEGCSYQESMNDMDNSQYTLPSYDRWYPLKHMRQSHYKRYNDKYIFRRRIERQLKMEVGVLV